MKIAIKRAPMDRFHHCFDHFHEVLGAPPHFWQNNSRLGVLIGPKRFFKVFKVFMKLKGTVNSFNIWAKSLN